MESNKRRFDVWSFMLGVAVAAPLFACIGTAAAFNLNAAASAGTKLVSIKSNLDGDVRALTGDARTLYSDKESLMQIKDQLLRLATDTRAQIDSISRLVGEVEGHIKGTQNHISTTSQHVNDIDAVRQALK